jgi:hypothetical protein
MKAPLKPAIFISYAAIISILFLLSYNGLAQQPSWTDPAKRKMLFPENEYLVAFYTQNFDKSQTIEKQIQKGLEYAKTDIAESVQVTITRFRIFSIIRLPFMLI